ncbi:MAG: CPBP family intramembrane metalloprotease [candidate division WOR-3 bacterium]|nr:CPBP family intramembrane metalloprotease [candidate division WOR-3 bacterium]
MNPEPAPPLDRKAVGVYLLIAFAGSWSRAGAVRLFGGRLTGDVMSAAVGVPFMLVPMVAAFVVQRWVKRRPVAGPLGVSFELNRWWLVAWLSPLVITFAVIGVSLFLPGVRFSTEMAGLFERFRGMIPEQKLAQMREAFAHLPVHPFWLLLGQGLFAGLTMNAVAGFGEELGWRGFLFGEFSSFGFWRSSLLIGAIWGIWHAPLVLQGLQYRSHPVPGVAMMTAWCILLSPLFSYIRLKARSVVAVSILHGSFNAFSGLALLMVTGGNDLLVGVPGLSGFIVLGLLNILLAFAVRRVSQTPPAPASGPRPSPARP